MSVIGKEVFVIKERNPDSAYCTQIKTHHIRHFLADDSVAIVVSVVGEKYNVNGESKNGNGEVFQTLHKGQVRII